MRRSSNECENQRVEQLPNFPGMACLQGSEIRRKNLFLRLAMSATRWVNSCVVIIIISVRE